MASLLRTGARLRPLSRLATHRTLTTSSRPLASAATAMASEPASTSDQPFFPDEPQRPQIRTSIPGPQSKKAIEELDQVFDTRSLNMLANYQNSFGN